MALAIASRASRSSPVRKVAPILRESRTCSSVIASRSAIVVLLRWLRCGGEHGGVDCRVGDIPAAFTKSAITLAVFIHAPRPATHLFNVDRDHYRERRDVQIVLAEIAVLVVERFYSGMGVIT